MYFSRVYEIKSSWYINSNIHTISLAFSYFYVCLYTMIIFIIKGTKYVGTWKDGKREGHGELIHANHKYVGTYKEDRVSSRIL